MENHKKMSTVKKFLGLMFGLLLYVVVKLAAGCATVKTVEETIVQCIPPAVEQAAAIYGQCKSQGGADAWCGALSSRAALDFIACLWEHHTKGKCDKDCPFHNLPDGGL